MPEQVLEDLQENNRQITDQELAEICGDANFNANLHPPLLPRELSYPTGESGDREHQIPSCDLLVKPDPDNAHRLILVRKSNQKRVIPVDLGFLNPRMRPFLFQLLSRFAPGLNFNLPIPDSPTAMRDDTFSGMRYRPRISYEGKLILARRQWQITHDLFPSQKPQESAADYFLRIQDWYQQQGLPQEVFVRVTLLPSHGISGPHTAAKAPEAAPEAPEPSAKASKAQAKTPVREHLYKPQYIDFTNPLLVDLLARMADSLERFFFTFEERLPAHEHLPSHGKDRYACEMIFQADFPGGLDD